MPLFFRFLNPLLGVLLLGGSSIAAEPASAHSLSPHQLSSGTQPVEVDTSDTPAPEPYATDRSLAYHVLATPAYVLHGVTRPLGWGVKYVERKFPNLFQPRRPPRGVVPLVELGGPVGFLGGVALYDNHLFGSNHSARIEGQYGGTDTFEGEVSYEIPSPFGPGTRFKTVVNVFSDPKSEFYLGGNDSNIQADEARFSRDQLDMTASVDVALSESAWSGGFDVLYEHTEVGIGDGERGDRLGQVRPPGLGTIDLFTSRVLLRLDRTHGRPRTYRGTEMLLQLDYSHDLTAERFRYGRYVAEVRQYLPVGFFPNSRRLVLRARLEQVEPLFGGTAVPFYQLPSLGGQRTLRGFRSNRFQNNGTLVLNAEYRYPLWSNFDALFFVDSGQVFDALSEVAADRFHWSYGGGLHVLHRKGLSFRFEVAGSTEGVRTILTVESAFRRVAR